MELLQSNQFYKFTASPSEKRLNLSKYNSIAYIGIELLYLVHYWEYEPRMSILAAMTEQREQ